MIQFTCGSCGKVFNVPDHFAGRSARCKGCSNKIIVPAASVAVPIAAATHNNEPTPAPTPAPSKISMRTRRLRADAEAMIQAFSESESIHVKPIAGDPPEKYQVEYFVHSLQVGKNGKPIPRDHHQVEIQLTSEYPRISPMCKMLTPIYHPNIDEASICVGDHWTAGERLSDLVIRIGEMIGYQLYNIRSPLNAEAAMWADLHAGELPIDARDLHPPTLE